MFDSGTTVERTVFTLRMMYGALLAGVAVFALIAFNLVQSRSLAEGSERQPVLLIALAGLSLALAIAYPIARRIHLGRLRLRVQGDSDDEAAPKRLEVFTTLWIVGTAMIEAPTIFATVIFLVSGDKLGLLATAIGIVLLMARWPSEENYQRFAAATADTAG